MSLGGRDGMDGHDTDCAPELRGKTNDGGTHITQCCEECADCCCCSPCCIHSGRA